LTSVLVVDDDPRILRLLCSFLKAEGYDVATAEDGRTALDSIAASPEVVLLDLNLPDIQGDEVFRRARASGYQGPIVLISADLRAEQVAREMGADGCLTKPFDPSDLFQMLEQLLDPLKARAS
jgi:DNA-binding response OmpR family regulator